MSFLFFYSCIVSTNTNMNNNAFWGYTRTSRERRPACQKKMFVKPRAFFSTFFLYFSGGPPRPERRAPLPPLPRLFPRPALCPMAPVSPGRGREGARQSLCYRWGSNRHFTKILKFPFFFFFSFFPKAFFCVVAIQWENVFDGEIWKEENGGGGKTHFLTKSPKHFSPTFFPRPPPQPPPPLRLPPHIPPPGRLRRREWCRCATESFAKGGPTLADGSGQEEGGGANSREKQVGYHFINLCDFEGTESEECILCDWVYCFLPLDEEKRNKKIKNYQRPFEFLSPSKKTSKKFQNFLIFSISAQ